MVETLTTFTEDDIAIGPVLGPEYRASQRWAESITEKLDENELRPLIDQIGKDIADKLWDAARDSIIYDTECNASGHIRYMVEQTVQALLTGEKWAMERYPYANYAKGEAIRKAVAVHGGEELLMRRIADLEAEITKRDDTIQFLRR